MREPRTLLEEALPRLRRSAIRWGERALAAAKDDDAELKPWDRQFMRWIEEAEALGRDPNDVGDEKWSDPLPAIRNRYHPLFDENSVVLELGPGTGRYTRHFIGRCRELVLVDYSKVVCDFLSDYFANQGPPRIILATDYELNPVDSDSIDTIIANGVFEHIYLEGFYRYFETFHRILRPGGRGIFNFNNIMSQGGFEWFHKELPKQMDGRSIFRFYHPETVEALCRRAGLEVVEMSTSEHRFAFLTFRKPA